MLSTTKILLGTVISLGELPKRFKCLSMTNRANDSSILMAAWQTENTWSRVGVGAPQLTLEWHCRRFHVGVRYPKHVSFPYVSLSLLVQVAAWFVLMVSFRVPMLLFNPGVVCFTRLTFCNSCHTYVRTHMRWLGIIKILLK